MSPLSARVRAANTLFAAANDDAIGDHFSPDYVAHVTDRRLPGGHALVRHQLALYRAAFSDLRLEVEILVEADDRIAWQRTLRAVHSGPFLGFPATGAELIWRDVVTSRIAADRIVEEWVITDLVERLVLARKRPAARAR